MLLREAAHHLVGMVLRLGIGVARFADERRIGFSVEMVGVAPFRAQREVGIVGGNGSDENDFLHRRRSTDRFQEILGAFDGRVEHIGLWVFRL